MSTFMMRRVFAPLVLAALVGLLTAVGHLGLEQFALGRISSRQFLWEPTNVVWRATTPLAADSSSSDNTSVSPLGRMHVATFTVHDLPSGLGLRDFAVTSNGTGTYRVIRVEPKGRVTQSNRSHTQRIALLFDQSSSVTANDPSDQRLVAGTRIINALPPDIEASVNSFPAGFWDTSTRQFGATTDRRQACRAIESLAGNEGGGTPTFEALNTLIEQHDGTSAILCFTDGVANDFALMPSVLAKAKQVSITVHFIAFGATHDWQKMEQFAHQTGGSLRECKSADQIAGLTQTVLPSLIRRTYDYTVTVQSNSEEILKPGDTRRGSVLISGTDRRSIILVGRGKP